MKTILNRPAMTFSPADAEKHAAAMQAGEPDGWTYKAVHGPKGTSLSLIQIFDETGEFVGNL